VIDQLPLGSGGGDRDGSVGRVYAITDYLYPRNLMPDLLLSSAAVPAALSFSVRPKIVSAASEPPRGDDRLHEVKHDGHRLIAGIGRKGRSPKRSAWPSRRCGKPCNYGNGRGRHNGPAQKNAASPLACQE
jgi:hypothetical protein